MDECENLVIDLENFEDHIEFNDDIEDSEGEIMVNHDNIKEHTEKCPFPNHAKVIIVRVTSTTTYVHTLCWNVYISSVGTYHKRIIDIVERERKRERERVSFKLVFSFLIDFYEKSILG